MYVLRTCRTTLLFNYCTSNYNCTFKNSDNNDSTSVDAASAADVRKINDNSQKDAVDGNNLVGYNNDDAITATSTITSTATIDNTTTLLLILL